MDAEHKIEYIEFEIQQVEEVIEEVIDVVKPQIKAEVNYCFDIQNILIGYFLSWWFKTKSE